jgi:hypothetical protein
MGASLLLLLLSSPGVHGAEAFGSSVFYVGDLHAHTGYSGDAGSADLGNCTGSCGNLADVFTTARDNGLDFLAITDHVNSGPALSAGEFADLNSRVLAAHDPAGGFVTLPAGEIWFTITGTNERIGHKTLLLFGSDAALAGLTLADVRISSGSAITDCADIWAWMDTLTAGFGDALLLPHHPAVQAPMPTEWSCHDDGYSPSVEVYSEHGNSLDASGYDTPGDGIYEDHTAQAAMDPNGYGLVFGFVGGTDSHDTRPGEVCELDTEHPSHLYGGGLTVAVLDATETFDRPALYDAIAERRTYVTTGPALPWSVEWSAAGHSLGHLGEELLAPETLPLDAVVSIPADRASHVVAVELVGPYDRWSLTDDGAGTWTGNVPAGDVPPWLYVAIQVDGASWYAGTECPDGGDDTEWLWGSPSPISLWPDDVDADGSSVWLGDCDDTDPRTYPGAVDRWYDGLDRNCAGDDDFDADADGHRGEAGGGDDCDDFDPWAYPGAPERWYDGLDQACDGGSDYDADADGFDTEAFGGTDCDDRDTDVFPGADEVWYDGVDQDCLGDSDFDQDGDGTDAGPGGDCDDLDATVGPSAVETWYDGVDQDCDGSSDYDQDQDGHTSAAWGGDDCDDTDGSIHAGAPEIWYDGIDQDCDPATERDADGDGLAAPYDCHDRDPRRQACEPASPGCTSAPAGPWLGLAAPLLLALRRSRRSR